jgi:hypothetical protein
MNDAITYTPPKVWEWNKENGGRFANINRPTAGPTHDKELPVGRHPLQLYSLATPNGVKVTVMLEELLAVGHRAERPAVLRGRKVNCIRGELSDQLHECHDAHDFETRTQDKIVDSKTDELGQGR